MATLNVAIIGQGRSGRDIHGAYLSKNPEHFRIVATVDLIEERRQRSAKEYGCDVYADYRELMKRTDIDLVVNALPSHLHVPVTLEFLKAGFNVLCEKPLAHTVADVNRLIAASQRSGKVLAVFQQSRYAPYFVQIQKVIASGVLGRIVQINMAWNGFARRWDWQTLQRMNGGNLLNTGPHPLDQALHLYGEGMPKVFCRMDRVNTYGDAEDHVKLILSGDDHPLIDLEISSCAPFPGFLYNIYGSRGGLRATMTSVEWKYFVPEEAPEQKLIETPLCKPDGTPAYCSEQLPWREEKWTPSEADGGAFTTATGGLYGQLYRTLTTGVPLEVTPQQVRRQIAVIEECRRQNPHIY
ncbi:MAG TPA: Gfo/Idh/MocA family oxidoreductase [Armatimonadota bacterium]|nr:Gfo/Idh/MocA family oxidoreductase [Armatimonadota bacterium]HPO71123.1 Gfo/Idh/MocA family oxidoreductase [Armatimonadota bacterium]